MGKFLISTPLIISSSASSQPNFRAWRLGTHQSSSPRQDTSPNNSNIRPFRLEHGYPIGLNSPPSQAIVCWTIFQPAISTTGLHPWASAV